MTVTLTKEQIRGLVGVWVRVEHVVGASEEGLLTSSFSWRHGWGASLARDVDGRLSHVDMFERGVASIVPIAMPEPPQSSILESPDRRFVYWRSPDLEEDEARWFEVGTYDPMEWSVMHLAADFRPVHVVRWGQ